LFTGKPDIAIVHYSGPPTIGGVQAVMAAHARALTDSGYKVTVVVGRGGDFYPGVDVKVIPAIDPRHASISEHLRVLEREGSVEGCEEVISGLEDKLYEALSSCSICMVHNIFTMDKNILLTVALCRVNEKLREVRFVAWTHDAVFLREEFKERYPVHEHPWNLLRHPLQGVRYVAVSSSRAEEIMSRWGEEKVDVRPIPNGISPADLLGISHEDYGLLKELGALECFPVILMPVRVLERKNVLTALKVVKSVVEKGKEPRLIVTGPPGTHLSTHAHYFQSLKEEMERLEIGGYVKFLYEFRNPGDPSQRLEVTDELVAALYRISDILFLPSTEEGFGLPLLEAGVFKLPILCSDIGPFREIGGENLELFSLNCSPKEIAEKLISITQGARTGRMFRSTMQNYRWEEIFSRQIEPLILELWEEKKK